MPDKEFSRLVPKISFDPSKRQINSFRTPDYAELQVTSNFSFLQGASHPEELIAKAAELGTRAIAITDINSLAGIVRGHLAAKNYPIQYIVGSKLQIQLSNGIFTILAYPTNRKSYGSLCRLLTLGKKDVPKDEISLSLEDFLKFQKGLFTTIVPPYSTHDYELSIFQEFEACCAAIKDNASESELVSFAIQKTYGNDGGRRFLQSQKLSDKLEIQLVVTNDVHYHVSERHKLQQVLTCIKHGTTIEKAGFILFQNAERYLKTPREMWRLFKDFPSALKRTMEIAEATVFFSLDELRYEYPLEVCPPEYTPATYLRELVEAGLREKFGDTLPQKIRHTVEEEFVLIGELEYEKYFLTCYDIVKFARSRSILCQGRGAAANSIVCFCLGITSVNPAEINLLFARFVSKERADPPDIDIDFEHERREEVIQYIYSKFGRDYAGLTAGVVTYRQRSAIRDVGKALGLSLDIVDRMAKSIHRWTDSAVSAEELKELKLDAEDPLIENVLFFSKQILGFPRHLSQHVGGFIICKHPLCETVPILNAAMEGRTIIE